MCFTVVRTAIVRPLTLRYFADYLVTYAVVNHRRPSLSRRRCSCFEQSAAACHVRVITVCLPQPSEDTSI